MKRSIAKYTGAGVLAGVMVLGVSGGPAGAQGGPFQALDKARAVSDRASERTNDMNERVGVVRGTTATSEAPEPVRDRAREQEPQVVSATTTQRESRSRATKRYDPASHRDPFEPPTIAAENDETPRTPLERYEIGQLRLVGVVWGGPNNRAMVEDSAGLGYIVTQGTPIGSSGGFVRNIEPTRVLIEESVTNFYGEQEPREVVMELPQEDESP
jgi:type IV pilus assembly protein PilP